MFNQSHKKTNKKIHKEINIGADHTQKKLDETYKPPSYHFKIHPSRLYLPSHFRRCERNVTHVKTFYISYAVSSSRQQNLNHHETPDMNNNRCCSPDETFCTSTHLLHWFDIKCWKLRLTNHKSNGKTEGGAQRRGKRSREN